MSKVYPTYTHHYCWITFYIMQLLFHESYLIFNYVFTTCMKTFAESMGITRPRVHQVLLFILWIQYFCDLTLDWSLKWLHFYWKYINSRFWVTANVNASLWLIYGQNLHSGQNLGYNFLFLSIFHYLLALEVVVESQRPNSGSSKTE